MEATNKIILKGLKKKLGVAKAKWTDVLPEVIWSYHTTEQSTTKETLFKELVSKLEPKWIGPYRVKEVVGKGAYRLETLDGGVIPRTWNVANLHFYYS